VNDLSKRHLIQIPYWFMYTKFLHLLNISANNVENKEIFEQNISFFLKHILYPVDEKKNYYLFIIITKPNAAAKATV